MTPEQNVLFPRILRLGGAAASRLLGSRRRERRDARDAATDQPAGGRLCLAPRRFSPASRGICQEKHETEEDYFVR